MYKHPTRFLLSLGVQGSRMKYTAVIFDMDGTIISSETVWEQALITLLSSRSITVTPEIKAHFERHLHGVDLRSACALIKEHMNLPDSVDDLAREKRAIANALYPHEVTLIDGFSRFHRDLLSNACAVGIATNANGSTVQATNARLNLTQFFGEHIYHIDHVNGIGKPNPDVFLHAAQQLGHDPARCIVIEDSPHGIAAAKKAGMFCVGITTAKRPELLHQADMIIDHYDELDVTTLLHITN